MRVRGRPLTTETGRLIGANRVGRIQRQVRRAFVASSGAPLEISALLASCYPRLAKFKHGHRKSVHRALKRFAVSLGRLPHVQGRPALWAPKSACLLPTRCQDNPTKPNDMA
jgi:hypothetical protein